MTVSDGVSHRSNRGARAAAARAAAVGLSYIYTVTQRRAAVLSDEVIIIIRRHNPHQRLLHLMMRRTKLGIRRQPGPLQTLAPHQGPRSRQPLPHIGHSLRRNGPLASQCVHTSSSEECTSSWMKTLPAVRHPCRKRRWCLCEQRGGIDGNWKCNRMSPRTADKESTGSCHERRAGRCHRRAENAMQLPALAGRACRTRRSCLPALWDQSGPLFLEGRCECSPFRGEDHC